MQLGPRYTLGDKRLSEGEASGLGLNKEDPRGRGRRSIWLCSWAAGEARAQEKRRFGEGGRGLSRRSRGLREKRKEFGQGENQEEGWAQENQELRRKEEEGWAQELGRRMSRRRSGRSAPGAGAHSFHPQFGSTVSRRRRSGRTVPPEVRCRCPNI